MAFLTIYINVDLCWIRIYNKINEREVILTKVERGLR